jgi:phytoene synthase
MPDDPAGEGGRPNVDAAFAHCESLARAHYENFPVASRLVPADLRPHVCAIYAFARTADDFADEPEYDGRRVQLIDEWENRLDLALAGKAVHPVFVALVETVRRFDLPDRWLRDLLDAFRQDCTVTRYRDWDQLLDYCRRSANPVGRMVLHLFGYRDDRRAGWSDSICTALQLTNFWQDVAIDWTKGRVYLPEQDRLRHGVSEEDLVGQRCHGGFRDLMGELIERTRDEFRAGRPLLTDVQGRLALELRCVWHGGNRILDKIEGAGCDVFRRRPRIGRMDVVLAAGRALIGS